MSDFSSNDINEAKKRVREMRDRARGVVESAPNDKLPEILPKPKPKANEIGGIGEIFSSLLSSEDSSLILALVLILSRENADNTLIMALLYILL